MLALLSGFEASSATVGQLNLLLLMRKDGLVRKCCEVLQQRVGGLLVTEVAAVRYARHVHGAALWCARGSKICSNCPGLHSTNGWS